MKKKAEVRVYNRSQSMPKVTSKPPGARREA